jgi:SAM-dependent methyltransferase
MPAGAVYVGRPSRWGNPFAVDATVTSEEAVARYREWLATQPDVVEAARSLLVGQDLVCWCPLGAACHADVLLEVANPAGGAMVDADVHRHRAPVRVPVLCDFRVPDRDWCASRLDAAGSWPAGGVVLDAGCGPGAYVAGVLDRLGDSGAVVGLDIADVRARAARDEGGALGVAGDVVALPFADASFDAAMALHMLYHVPDIPAAVRELRRVVRPGGFLMVTTNAGDDEEEMTDLYLRAGGRERDAFGDWRFCIENAEPYLRAAFAVVELHLERSQLVVDDVAPVRNSFDSLRYLIEPGLESSLPWATFLDRVCEEAQRVIDADGAFVVNARTGIFVCA